MMCCLYISQSSVLHLIVTAIIRHLPSEMEPAEPCGALERTG